jgi:hypothetical protein
VVQAISTSSWLIRPRGTGPTVTAHLGTDADGGVVLEVRSAESGGHEARWRTGLTPRHAGILRILHSGGPGGLSARELSQRLFGDDDHQVTVRAEISRLRRALGPLVSTTPYRISAGVRFTAAPAGTA